MRRRQVQSLTTSFRYPMMVAMSDPGTPGESGGDVTDPAHIYKMAANLGCKRGPDQDYQFVVDISMSEDGRRFAVGAPFFIGEAAWEEDESMFTLLMNRKHPIFIQ